MKVNEEILLRARAKTYTYAGCRRVEERFDVKNAYTVLDTTGTTYTSKKVTGYSTIAYKN